MKRLTLIAGILAVSATALSAQNYYLLEPHASWNSGHWELVNNEFGWYTSATTKSNANRLVTFDPSGNYHNNGRVLFTQSTADTFDGASLTLSGGRLELRASDTTSVSYFSTINNVIVGSAGSAIGTGNFDNTQGSGINITNLTLNGNLLLEPAGSRQVRVNITNLTGAGDLTTGFNATSRGVVSVANAAGYTGNIVASIGRLDFNSSFSSAGGLVLNSGSELVLDQNLSFTSVTIGSTVLAEGTYTFAQLNSAYDAYFVNGGSGSITVSAIPEPSTFAALAGVVALGAVGLRRRRLVRA